MRDAAHALALVFFIWSLLASASSIAQTLRLDASAAALFSLLAPAVVLLAARSYRRDRRATAAGALLGLGLVCGFASYPAWIAMIASVGFGLGIEPVASAPPQAGGPALWTATVLLAPVFEEVLYRERLLSALRPVMGSGFAIAATSVLFAIPHLEPWRVLVTWLVGLALGGAMCASGSLALCIGIHMGLNLASWACGIPPVRMALSPETAALAGIGGLAAGIALARRTHPRSPPQPDPRSIEAFPA